MTREQWMYGAFAVLGAAVLIVAGIFVYQAGQRSADPNRPVPARAEEQGSRTVAEVPSGTAVPEKGAKVPGNVAVPESVAATAPGADTKARGFEMRIENGKFIPDTVIVYAGDIAHIEFTAVDKAYDVTQPDTGFMLEIPKGMTKILEGQFPAPGKYTLYCAACGGPDRGPIGYVTVVPK